jgi:D-hexose-6-phosphate mutarotase
MDIELMQGSAKAIISIDGAWLTNLSDDNGDILFPKRTIALVDESKKVRGGMHVCLPNFGPGGKSGLSQHGFGRELEWKVIARDDAMVALELTKAPDPYRGLRSQLTYHLSESSLTVQLDVKNNGNSALRLAPAFHPYFMTYGGEVAIDGQVQDLNELGEAQFITDGNHELQLESRKITISAESLPTWATWTDQLGHYVCVEPSLDGFSFNEHETTDEEMLVPGQTKTVSCTIAWA